MIVLSAADDDQKVAFQMQVEEKIRKQELPVNVTYHTFADPGTAKIGNQSEIELFSSDVLYMSHHQCSL